MSDLFKKILDNIIKNLHIWIAILLLLYTIIPLLSPVFFKLGLDRLGWYIQTIYRFFCHQRPERSVFLFGEKLTYSLEELSQNGYRPKLLGYTFVGNENLGYKIAFCTRDLFIYGTMAISGFVVGLSKRDIRIKWWLVLILALPMAIDGGTQFVAELLYMTNESSGDLARPFYLSNNLNRAVTGSLFGAGVGIFIHSQLKKAVQEDID
jgi:uncharacterized membrane protein